MSNPPAVEHPNKVIKYFRKFDGKTDVNEFIAHLTADLAEHHVTNKWISTNLDRILEGQALDFFKSRVPTYATNLVTTCNNDYDDLWKAILVEFKLFFNHDSQISTHKQANKALVYAEKSNPQEYVTSKLSILRNIDPNMTDSKIVEQLIKGLPIKLQLQFTSSQCADAHAFLEQLRKIDELLGRHSVTIFLLKLTVLF